MAELVDRMEAAVDDRAAFQALDFDFVHVLARAARTGCFGW